jgi:hypothetical protein
VLAAASAAALGACGGTSPSAERTTTTTAATTARFTYGPTPSVSAKMICRHETVAAIENLYEVRTQSTPHATWSGHRYTCTYRYPLGAVLVLWVKELPSLPATFAYMASLRHQLGDAQSLPNDGQGGYQTTAGWTVTRKDNKVLVVDVGGMPRRFGHPYPSARANLAQTVTQLIFACWRGD